MKKPTSLLALAMPTRTVTESAESESAVWPAHSASERKNAPSRPFFIVSPLSVCHSLRSERLPVFQHAGCAERSFEPLGSQVLAGHDVGDARALRRPSWAPRPRPRPL